MPKKTASVAAPLQSSSCIGSGQIVAPAIRKAQTIAVAASKHNPSIYSEHVTMVSRILIWDDEACVRTQFIQRL